MITRHRTGFTLVEMLVALAIFGLIAAAGVSLLSFSVTNREAVKAASDQGAALQRARQLMKADLGQAIDRPVRGAEAANDPAFMGAAGDRLFSVTRSGWSNYDNKPRASLQRVEYRLRGGRLTRRVRQAVDGATTRSEQTLLEGVRTSQVQFLSAGLSTNSWPANNGHALPDAVTVELDLPRYGRVTQWFLVGGGPG